MSKVKTVISNAIQSLVALRAEVEKMEYDLIQLRGALPQSDVKVTIENLPNLAVAPRENINQPPKIQAPKIKHSRQSAADLEE